MKTGEISDGIVRDKRRGNAGDNLFPLFYQRLNGAHIGAHMFGVLRTYLGAFSAIDTFTLYNLCLMVFYLDGFYRTIAYTFITVFTIGLFKLQNAFHFRPPQIPLCARIYLKLLYRLSKITTTETPNKAEEENGLQTVVPLLCLKKGTV